MFFASDKNLFNNNADVIHFVNIISEKIPNKPYVVDFEHPIGLANFMSDYEYMETKVFPFLNNDNCKAIICMSKAAQKTLKDIYKNQYESLASKVRVVYPTINIEKVSNIKPSPKYIKTNKALKLLFVGNDVYRKGLEEILIALNKINEKYGINAVQLFVVSEDAQALLDRYKLENVNLSKPGFSKQDILKYFFKPADFFIMPTKLDTFGMVYIDALASGTPVIATTQYAIPEIVTHNTDGILIDYDGLLDNDPLPNREMAQAADSSKPDKGLSSRLYEAVELIIKDSTICNQLKKNSTKKFSANEVLSIERRNKDMLTIYKQAILKDRFET
jgi:glycosyltransferase involved in cell wall biosynthesis